MDINRPLSSRFKVNKPITTEAGKKGAEAARIRSASNIELNRVDLKEGQVIKGQILDHRHNEIKLMVEPGNQIISAKLSGEISFSIGQYAGFIVSEAASDRLVLRLLLQEVQANDSIILKALTATGITINDRNKAIVEELLAQRMPVDKQTLQTLIRQSAANREASPLCLVLMYKNNIPINNKNLQQFQAYLDGTHQLLYKIKDITGNITKILNASAYPDAAYSDLAYPDSLHPAHAPNNIQSTPEGFMANAGAGDNIISRATEAASWQAELSQANINSLPNSILSLNTNMLGHALAANDKLIQIFQSNAVADLQLPPDAVTPESNSGLPLSEAQEPQANTNYQTYKLADIMKQEDINNLLKYLSATQDPDGIKDSLANGSATIGEALTYIQKALYKLDKASITGLLSSPEYAELLEKAFFKKWTLAPENVSEKHSVEKFYKQLEDDLQRFNRLVDSIHEADDYTPLQKPLNNLQDNLQFMKDLNNAFAFLQLPVEFKDRQVHADLYVLTRKKSQKEKDQALNVHLYLETANLGSLNIHLQMTNNQIETVFYPESREVAQIIRDNLPILISSLQTKGYNVRADVTEADKQPGLFKKLIEQNTQDNNITRYTFDIRT